ncbi:MAG: hypothetical protein EXR27_08800 [Betaproteobacteria bacterium]|nr:hypothetical protein [Betaproteobacteria bacterium]
MSDPAARGAQFALFTCRPVRHVAGRHVLETDRGRIHLIAPQDAQRTLPGVVVPAVPFIDAAAIGSRDLPATRSLFDARAIAFAHHPGTVQVAAHEALGATLVFHDRGDDRVFDFLHDPETPP